MLNVQLASDTGKGSGRLRVRVLFGYGSRAVGAAAGAATTTGEAWVPTSMDEEYRLGKGALAVEGHATYSNFRKFKVETSTTIKR